MTDVGAPDDDASDTHLLPVVTSAIRRRWTSSVFGIVASGAVRRRPSDIGRVLTTIVVIAAISLWDRVSGQPDPQSSAC